MPGPELGGDQQGHHPLSHWEHAPISVSIALKSALKIYLEIFCKTLQ